MPYPQELKELIKVVEKTRPERVARKKKNEEVPFLSLEERKKILDYHPDFREEGRREIKVGPSKGYRIAHEMVDMLEAKSRVNPDLVDLSQVDYETDVLVIGGGGAGTSAALLAQEQGAKVIIATKLRHGDANTMMAEGGIQAATKGWKDSPYYHYLDVMGGGHFKNIPDLVDTLVTEAPDVILWLEKLGCNFSKFPDGTLKTLHGGGTCRKRMHYAADITGAEIMRTIRDEARNRSQDIKVIEFSPAVELILNENGECAGALLYNMETEEYFIVKAKAVIMATGGSGRLHIQNFMTTNHYGATADGIVIAYRAGVGICFLHTVQYHPTGVVFPEQAEGILITEKFRGSGANLINIDGQQFVNEREPRDVESAAVIKECVEKGKGIPTPTGKFGVWLDSPMVDTLSGEGTVEREFPGKFILYKRFGIDISKEPMLIYPTLHYQNGGLEYKSTGETTLPGLFVAGEVGGGVHGQNRLMGNSLLDILVFGRIAGKSAADYAKSRSDMGILTLDHVRAYHKGLEDADIETDRVAPMLLPDYTLPHIKERQLTSCYVGTLR
ncbi:MAG: succinate dehydrogenase/fumarate reductase flavoprotein subunit [Deltaproteobacteria bacterium CG_4_9_14_3_um_filter_44_9]|nr:MAG: succinate dehydrogenase/fumarate reductase flavoprotein subunit [Deltaproteobacteria bacterium CG06_land_8_20_14_3_00_44_19]PIX25490.1 MAG: succinate dehydrogenase/fumarate reductase flavoprotein subunit [Deltaproteobacteria bacterium CG_4_8_14_3_um_filter_43_13]PJB43505.1 MAG: succinate dehydrogenase/fumarate reductase flavoprotein subunit [Deltaproteobacteria bacterium CG_4_9_14_3_um_filter_44_9]